MSTMKMPLPNDYFSPEVTFALGSATVTSITITGGIATVAHTSHGFSTGQLITWSGVTGAGVTCLNGAHFQITVTGVNSYTFPTTLVGTPGGTEVVQPIYIFSSGYWNVLVAANAIIEYNPDNTADAPLTSSLGVTGATWRTLVATSTSGDFFTDGWAVRARCVSTTANSFFSQVF